MTSFAARAFARHTISFGAAHLWKSACCALQFACLGFD